MDSGIPINEDEPRLRKTLIVEMIKELRGPRSGTYEELKAGDNPFKEYITGIVCPPKKTDDLIDEINPDSEFEDKKYSNKLNQNINDDIDEDFTEGETANYIPNALDPRYPISSFGISFFVNNNCDKTKAQLDLCISWARYNLNDNIWKRSPQYSLISINPFQKYSDPVPLDEDKKIKLWIRSYSDSENDNTQIILTVENGLDYELEQGVDYDVSLAKLSLFQPSIRVVVKNIQIVPKSSSPRSEMEYISGDDSPYARGYMCAAIWKKIDYINYVNPEIIWSEYSYLRDKEGIEIADTFLNCDVRSEFLPMSAVPMPEFELKGTDEIPELSVYALSEAWSINNLERKLTPWYAEYKKWIERNKSYLKVSGDNSEFAKKIISHEEKVLTRLDKGIKCLLNPNNEDARLAFCFANRVIYQQRLWKTPSLSENPYKFTWRPFQIAFFLTSLESLYNENSEDRDVLDLLWVSTGGGKTEAYLSMMAFVMALRRIRSKNNPEINNGDGVSIITRYTLRLLTVQQFRRTLLMVTAAEYLRVLQINGKHGWRPDNYPDNSDWLYGKYKYSIGMLVGGNVSPNSLTSAIASLSGTDSSEYGGHKEPAQLIKCPVCGEWLSIPYSESDGGGINPGEYTFHLIIKSEISETELRNRISNPVRLGDITLTISISQTSITSEMKNYYILNVKWVSEKTAVTRNTYNDLILKCLGNGVEILSFTTYNMGYFPKKISNKGKDEIIDFDIYCPNPECALNQNHSWAADSPFPFEIFEKESQNPLIQNGSIPIPAYTVDEQIYHRAPTVIISTVDKIARFAFDPRAGTLFGDVKYYNKYFGYVRDMPKDSESYDLYPDMYVPKNSKHVIFKKIAEDKENYNLVHPNLPPDLIIQDELHLLDGSLGSMFGLYELMIRSLIKSAGGHPKYVASSATVTNADKQIHKLFNCNTLQFPPYGLKASDSFFVKLSKATWDEDKPGRVYMGILGPGKGSLTPLIRIWARLLKTTNDFKISYGSNNKNHLNNFWTVVGYCNSMRELGGLGALYQEDIVERLENISTNGNIRDISSNIMNKYEELSSRKSSTSIPQILEVLENEQNNVSEPEMSHDTILTTSMFGTGVDIPHLSLMVVQGQPKTTAQYIQASGRVGREVGAFIPVLFKPGRPRDLSHYEMFTGYHNTLNLSVEQTSVSPYSTGCLERALGPVITAYLRNAKNMSTAWFKNNGKLILDDTAESDINAMELVFKDMSENIDDDSLSGGRERFEKYLKSNIQRWIQLAKESDSSFRIYEQISKYNKADANVVLGDKVHPQHPRKPEEPSDYWSVYGNTPQALRDVEDTTEFGV